MSLPRGHLVKSLAQMVMVRLRATHTFCCRKRQLTAMAIRWCLGELHVVPNPGALYYRPN